MAALLTGNALAQCDSIQRLNDSVTVAQSNEIVRLQGELRTRAAMIDGLSKIVIVKDSFEDRNERYRIFEREKDFKENRTWLAAMTGVIFILTLIITFRR